MSSEPSDLLDRARSGDPVAFEELIRPYTDSVRRFALSFTKDPVDADDLAQDALIKAYRSFSTYDGAAALTTWLYTVARSTFLDSRRGKLFKARGRERDLDDVHPDGMPNQETLLVQREAAQRLWNAIRELDAKFRIPLVLADVEGLTYDEVAAIEGVPVGTIRSRISRARSKLTAVMGDGSTPPPAGAHERGTQSPTMSSHSVTRGAR